VKAVVYERYGPPDVLHVADVDRPTPKGDQILVKVHATTVNRLDCHTRDANRPSGLAVSLLSRAVSGPRRPRQPVLGSEFAGEVQEVGPAVTEFKVGERVFGNTGLKFGCHAEYLCVSERARVGTIPAGTGFEEAAPLTDGAFNALWCLRQAGALEGRKILVYGASGAIGTAAVQLARYFGADVTGVCGTANVGTANVELVHSLGAAQVVDYLRQDFTSTDKTYDVIFDAVGKLFFGYCKGSLEPGGCYLATDGFRNIPLALWTRWAGDRKVRFALPPRYPRSDVALIKELVEAGKFRAVIDRCYPLEVAVDAVRYVETAQKTGNVVLTIPS
jgi:NADPH:quinone reductase-like Zn-dependent oxidoreductase